MDHFTKAPIMYGYDSRYPWERYTGKNDPYQLDNVRFVPGWSASTVQLRILLAQSVLKVNNTMTPPSILLEAQLAAGLNLENEQLLGKYIESTWSLKKSDLSVREQLLQK